MAGGPINGVPVSGMLGGLGAGAVTAIDKNPDSSDKSRYLGIIVPTVLQLSTEALSYWTSMTCLYDRYWTPEPEKVTLPFCMFHVKKITPHYSVDVSKKRVLLYEPDDDEKTSAAALSDRMRPQVTQTITDNAVKNPTTYTMEAIVPFQPIGRYITGGVKTLSDMVAGIAEIVGGSGFASVWETVFSSAFSVLKTANQLSELAGKLPGMGLLSAVDGGGMDSVSFTNMNSLEAMADSCRMLCMKMWTGYQYKYVMITDLSYDKDPKEDNVFRATMTLQEMPVLTVTKPGSKTANDIKRNWAVNAVTAVNNALVTPLVMFTGVKTAAGGEAKSGSDIGKAALGL